MIEDGVGMTLVRVSF